MMVRKGGFDSVVALMAHVLYNVCHQNPASAGGPDMWAEIALATANATALVNQKNASGYVLGAVQQSVVCYWPCLKLISNICSPM